MDGYIAGYCIIFGFLCGIVIGYIVGSNKSNEEIAGMTGRSAIAVRTKRYKYTGHYVQEDEWNEYVPRLVSLSLTQEEKVERIKNMAMQMKIRLKGESR